MEAAWELVQKVCCCKHKNKHHDIKKVMELKELKEKKSGGSEKIGRQKATEEDTVDASWTEGDSANKGLKKGLLEGEEEPVLEEKEFEHGKSADSILNKIIKDTDIDRRLAEAEKIVREMEPVEPFKKISTDGKDPLELYFQVGDDPVLKEKYHKFLSSYTVPYDPLWFVLRNCVLTPAERLQSNSNLSSYQTVHRKKIGDTYYLVNHVLFKKVMLMDQKESLCIKAVKALPNGDCIEQNISCEHPHIPPKDGVQRLTVLANPILYTKTPEGLKAKSFNHVIPRSSIGFTVLKPLMNSSYNNTFKGLIKVIEDTPKLSVQELEKEFD